MFRIPEGWLAASCWQVSSKDRVALLRSLAQVSRDVQIAMIACDLDAAAWDLDLDCHSAAGYLNRAIECVGNHGNG